MSQEISELPSSAFEGLFWPIISSGSMQWPLAILSGFLVIACQGPVSETSPPQNRPNIILMLADDVGWNDVGYHGSEIRTPHIDSLRQSGVELDQFYVFPACTPTRAGLLSGQNPSRFGILRPSSQYLPAEILTLPELLRNGGYSTAITGKWHLGLTPEVGPLQYGFDSSYGHFHGEIDKYTHRWESGGLSWHRNDEYLEEEGHAADLITNEAIRLIRERDPDRPFFVYVPFGQVHHPFQEEEKWISMYRDTISNEARRLYAAAMAHLDDNIGRILSTLIDEGLEEETLVVFASDNGAQERKIFPPSEYEGRFAPLDRLGDDRPLRGWKFQVYEGGIRVPAAVSWPGRLRPGKVVDVISICDLLPTLAHAAGLEVPPGTPLDGVDVWPVLNRESRVPERLLFWQIPSGWGIRQGDWKLVHHGQSLREGEDELFNLALDPYETTDLSGANKERILELKEVLESVL